MNKIKTLSKVTSLSTAFLTGLALVVPLTQGTALADKEQMVDAPKTTSAVNNKYPGEYSEFNPKVIQGVTKVIPFGGGSENWAKSTYGSTLYDVVKLSGNEKLKGKIGMLYSNVGSYDGHTVDLKVTVMDWYRNDGVKDAVYTSPNKPPKETWAAFGTSDFSVYTLNDTGVKYRVDYVDHDTGEPVKVSGQWTFNDIDSNQHLMFDNDTFNSIDNIYYSGTSAGSDDTWVDPIKLGGKQGFYGDAHKHNTQLGNDGTVATTDKKGAITATFSNSDHFTMSWVSALSFGEHAAAVQDNLHKDTNFWTMNGNYDPKAADKDNQISEIYNDIDASNFNGAYLKFGEQAILPNKPDKPYKYVSDSDEGTDTPAEVGTAKSVDHNVLKNRYENYHYQITEHVPDVRDEFKYNKFIITDQLDKVLDSSNVHVYNMANQDVTDDFTTNIDSDNKLTVTAKDHSLARDDFYRETYKITFDAKVKPGVSLADHADPKHKDQAVIYNQPHVSTNYGDADGNKTTTNIPFTNPSDKKAVSQDGNGDGDSLETDFDKDFKFTVNGYLTRFEFKGNKKRLRKNRNLRRFRLAKMLEESKLNR